MLQFHTPSGTCKFKLANELYIDPEDKNMDDPNSGDRWANRERFRSNAIASSCNGSSCLKHAQNPKGCTRSEKRKEILLLNGLVKPRHEHQNNRKSNQNTQHLNLIPHQQRR
ncbi:hypothetical protein HJC23_005752 [Cyclotella cryptica]|uniref:Uncharacterized protein n=1 Tax=Cyclotella cryptica TaxID=29204 RepID=A0ABD3QED3_9STRA